MCRSRSPAGLLDLVFQPAAFFLDLGDLAFERRLLLSHRGKAPLPRLALRRIEFHELLMEEHVGGFDQTAKLFQLPGLAAVGLPVPAIGEQLELLAHQHQASMGVAELSEVIEQAIRRDRSTASLRACGRG